MKAKSQQRCSRSPGSHFRTHQSRSKLSIPSSFSPSFPHSLQLSFSERRMRRSLFICERVLRLLGSALIQMDSVIVVPDALNLFREFVILHTSFVSRLIDSSHGQIVDYCPCSFLSLPIISTYLQDGVSDFLYSSFPILCSVNHVQTDDPEGTSCRGDWHRPRIALTEQVFGR